MDKFYFLLVTIFILIVENTCSLRQSLQVIKVHKSWTTVENCITGENDIFFKFMKFENWTLFWNYQRIFQLNKHPIFKKLSLYRKFDLYLTKIVTSWVFLKIQIYTLYIIILTYKIEDKYFNLFYIVTLWVTENIYIYIYCVQKVPNLP